MAANLNAFRAGDWITLQHEDGRRYGPIELKTLGLDPVTLYVRGLDDSIRAAKSLQDWLDVGWRVVEFEPVDQLPVKPGAYRLPTSGGWLPENRHIPGALYVLDANQKWFWYKKMGPVGMRGQRLIPLAVEED